MLENIQPRLQRLVTEWIRFRLEEPPHDPIGQILAQIREMETCDRPVVRVSDMMSLDTSASVTQCLVAGPCTS
jgi:hypothetical protein